MAHGFLSYNKDHIGPSGVETRLEKYLERKFDEQTTRLKGYLRDRFIDALFHLRTKSPRSPKPYSWSKEESTPLGRMLSGSAFQKSLPSGSDAINPDSVHGGEVTFGKRNFVNFANSLRPEPSAGEMVWDTTAQRVDDDGGIFAKSAALANRDQNGENKGEIVQAIDRLTMVTMGLGAAIDAQTKSQQVIAQAQLLQSNKLARKALISSETSGFTNDDFSSNVAYEGLARAGASMMGGGRSGGIGMGLGGGLMGGIGLKRSAALAGRQIMKRGAGRAATRGLLKLGGRGLAKKAAKVGIKGVGKSLGKKIPLLGLGLGAIFAAQRAMQGDFIGAGLELASGAASTVPGVGTAASVGIDAALMAKDMTAMADGGIVDSATNAIIGEDGKEGVFPLEGSRGKKTFRMFGEGLIDAQRSRKGLFGKLQAEGLKEYYDKQDGWGRMGDSFPKFEFNTNVFDGFGKTLKEILGAINTPWGKLFDFKEEKGNNGAPVTSSVDYGKRKEGWGIRAKNSGEQMQVNADGVFESKIGGVVTKIGEHKDIGQYVDIVNEERGVTERIADFSGLMPGIEVGASITPGMPVAKGNDAGIVHYEIRNGGNADPEKYKAKFGHRGTKDPTEFLEGISNEISNSTDINELSNVDNTSSTILNELSEETAANKSGGTTIINNVVPSTPTNTSNNQGSDVALGSRSEDLVSVAHTIMALRA